MSTDDEKPAGEALSSHEHENANVGKDTADIDPSKPLAPLPPIAVNHAKSRPFYLNWRFWVLLTFLLVAGTLTLVFTVGNASLVVSIGASISALTALLSPASKFGFDLISNQQAMRQRINESEAVRQVEYKRNTTIEDDAKILRMDLDSTKSDLAIVQTNFQQMSQSYNEMTKSNLEANRDLARERDRQDLKLEKQEVLIDKQSTQLNEYMVKLQILTAENANLKEIKATAEKTSLELVTATATAIAATATAVAVSAAAATPAPAPAAITPDILPLLAALVSGDTVKVNKEGGDGKSELSSGDDVKLERVKNKNDED